MNTNRIVPLTVLLLMFTVLGFPSFSSGAIIETKASAAMQILYDPLPNPPYTDVIDVSQTVTNPTNAQVNLDGNVTTAQVHSIWNFNDLDTVAGHGNLFFDFGMIGDDGDENEGEIAPHAMGYTVPGVN